jgi:hypothetical protein
LLRVTGAYVCTAYIARTTFLQQRTTNIFADIISNEIEWYPISATKVCERQSNVVPRFKRKHVSPVGDEIKIGLSVPIP